MNTARDVLGSTIAVKPCSRLSQCHWTHASAVISFGRR
jgi:hypothetical protein